MRRAPCHQCLPTVSAPKAQSNAMPRATAVQDLYTFSRCKSPLPTGLMHKLGIPLPADQVEVYLEDLEWEEFKVGGGDAREMHGAICCTA